MLPYSIPQNKFQSDQRFKCKKWPESQRHKIIVLHDNKEDDIMTREMTNFVKIFYNKIKANNH